MSSAKHMGFGDSLVVGDDIIGPVMVMMCPECSQDHMAWDPVTSLCPACRKVDVVGPVFSGLREIE